MIFNNKAYDILKWICTVALPALATLILAIGQIWNVSTWTVPIGATVAAVATFMGALLGVSSLKYKQLSDKEGSNG